MRDPEWGLPQMKLTLIYDIHKLGLQDIYNFDNHLARLLRKGGYRCTDVHITFGKRIMEFRTDLLPN